MNGHWNTKDNYFKYSLYHGLWVREHQLRSVRIYHEIYLRTGWF